MGYSYFILSLALTTACPPQSPEEVAEQYFEALVESDKDKLTEVVFEPSADRIGKSIIAAAPMLRRKGATEFFEMVFDRVPTSAEISAMSPVQACVEYMCDPPPKDSQNRTKRSVLGVVYENDDLAHVVYRVDGIPNLGETKRDLVTCINHGGSWRVVIPFQVWEAYLNYTLRPSMAKLSEGDAEQSRGPKSPGKHESN